MATTSNTIRTEENPKKQAEILFIVRKNMEELFQFQIKNVLFFDLEFELQDMENA
ncbi:MAG: hypothetical protein LBO64_06225 [Desulfovibrio sp.]|jgi:hypothetical protein|nr:hypothetical protein [Desulfovibrio sp.]